MLKRLELSGFKSFARPTALDFTTPITAIVGPNGSGKSNIAEAVRFVLGEQSIKSLRGKRGEDLIFNGTQSVPRQPKASVIIVFDNTKRVLPIDYDEVAIKRTVYRDSASDYAVNGSRVRLKDILEMLASVHIGASSHHIISQGEADRILLSSIKERRSMIEDALGLKIYHYKKTESERKLAKTNENLSQVKALKKEIEPHLRFLEKQVAKIKQAEQLREELKLLYTTYFTKEAVYLEHERKRLADERRGPEAELITVQSAMQATLKIIRDSEAEKKELLQLDKIEKEIEIARKRKDEISRSLGKIEGVLEYEKRKLIEEEQKITRTKDITVQEEVLVNLRNSISALNKEAEREGVVEKLREITRDMFEAVLAFCNELLSTQNNGSSVVTLKESIATKQNEYENLVRQMKETQMEADALIKKHAEMRESKDAQAGKERENEKQLLILQNKKTELTAALNLIQIKEERWNMLDSDFKLFLKEAEGLVGKVSYDTRGNAESADEAREAQNERKNKILRIKIKLEEIGVGGGEILREYKELKERDEFLEKEITDLEKSAESLLHLIEELEEKINEEFKSGVQKINKHFQELFVVMFGGGKASIRVIAPVKQKKKDETVISDEEIEASDFTEEEPEEGIDINVSLPRKKIKGLMMLSGGERALVSIALIFAMTRVNPPPFLILDETDAALDEINSRKYGEMLKNLSKETELILITHNRETMANAGVLYGVTAIDGVSRLLSVKFDEAKELAIENK